MKVANHHDKFFKESFSDLENAVDFIQSTFPKEILSHLDLSTLKLDNNSYTDEKLKEFFSDMVYDCTYNNSMSIKISILLEHKSYVPDYPHIQILKYMVGIWESEEKQKKPLKPVIPVIVFHGKDQWKSKSFPEYFKGMDENLTRFVPSFDYLLTDLSHYSNEEIKKKVFRSVSLRIALLMLKNIYYDDVLLEHFKDFIEIGKLHFQEEKGLKFLESVVRYLYQGSDEKFQDTIYHSIKEISQKGGDIVMTIARSLEKKGEKRGQHKKAIQTAKKMAQKGMDIDLISELTELSIDELKKVLKL